MKKVSLIILTFVISTLGIHAQQKMSERELDGLKGPVRSIKSEFRWEEAPILFRNGQIYRESKNLIKKDAEFSYDTNGKLLQRKLIRAAHDESLRKRNRGKIFEYKLDPNSKNSQADSSVQKNTESSSNTKKRLHTINEFEYDENGKIVEIREFTNTGENFRTLKFNYNDQAQLFETHITEGSYEEIITYRYDSEGLPLEMLKKRHTKPSDMIFFEASVYSEYKTDKHNNWTQRRNVSTNWSAKKDEEHHGNRSGGIEKIEFRKIKYF